jgi:phosphoribosylamine--glycine ligase
MITETGPKVIEFNSRFGDPETQVVLPLVDYDLVRLMLDTVEGNLGDAKLKFHQHCAVCVVIASGGYPDAYETGKQIYGLDTVETQRDVLVFHAGTKLVKNVPVTSGGRVLGITAVGPRDNLEETIDRAYTAVGKITFDNAYYRSDIGKKGVERLRQIKKLETT